MYKIVYLPLAEDDILATVEYIAGKLDNPPAAEALLDELDRRTVKSLACRWGMLSNEAVSAELERLHWAEYDSYIEKNGVKAFPGVGELMEALRAEKIRIAVATGSLVRIVRQNLKLLGIEEFVEEIATSEDCENGKPAPDVFLLAAKKLGVDPADCLVVEDAGNGLQGALSAGMACAGFDGSELPSDVALAPIVFSDYRKVKPADMREWHRQQKSKKYR